MTLSALPKFGPVLIRELEKSMGDDFARILEMSESALRPFLSVERRRTVAGWPRYFDIERERRLLEQWGSGYRIPGDSGFPTLLESLPDCPAGLYVRNANAELERCVAIIGTRHPSQYGRKIAREFAGHLAASGFTIISGLARGIDTEAHRAALQAGGKTAAVLGCGLDQLYPPENRDLMEEICDSAGVWTEFYFGRKADRQTFPQRNRIVSGISLAVIVIESGEKGGSMITARFALEQGKTVFAVPGRIDQPSAAGCHLLIQDGAQVAFSIGEVVRALRTEIPELNSISQTVRMVAESPAQMYRQLSAEEMAVLGALNEGDCLYADQLCDALGLSIARVSTALMLLEIKGLVCKRMEGAFERT